VGQQSRVCSLFIGHWSFGRRPLALLVLVFLGLGVTYALVMPCFESHDEWSHLSVVRHFAVYRALPPRVTLSRRALTGLDVAWYLEYHDPPLYYAPPLYHTLGALLTSFSGSGTDMDDLPYLLVPSPIWEAGWAPESNDDPWNKNIYAHRAEETLAQSSTVRAAYLLRLASLGLGVATILCTHALARLLWPDRPVLALGAAAFVALNPQFVAVSASVTNDNLLNALFSLCLVLALRFMRDGARWNRWALLGGLVGLGLLTKQSALLLLPLGLQAIVWQRMEAPRPRRQALASDKAHRSLFIVHCSFPKMLADGGAFLAAALGVGGWWYVRNAILYGDPLGLETHFSSQVPLARFGLNEALETMRSYWAAFGWAPLLVAPPVYTVLGLVMLAALAGVVIAIRPSLLLPRGGGRRGADLPPKVGGDRGGADLPPKVGEDRGGAALPPRVGGDRGGDLWRGLALLALAFVLNAGTFVRWAMATGVLSGRLLFPTLPVVGVLSAWGLSQWGRWPAVRWGLGIIVGLAFLFTAFVPWRYLRPAYATPRIPGGVPDTAQPVDATFQGGVRLAGYEPIVEHLEPGQQVHLALYWHTPAPLDQRYRVWVQLGPQDPTRRVAEHGDWLGGTLYPSDLWQVDDTVRQVYRLAVPDWAPAPALYWARVGLLDDAGMRVTLADHSSDRVVLGPWRMRSTLTFPFWFRHREPLPACVADFRLGTAIRLSGYDLEWSQEAGAEVLQLTLYWRAERALEGGEVTDYTVYVHLVDGRGRLLGQHDGPPGDGAYPTSWWLPGDIVTDQHTIRLDEPYTGAARLRVGMYDPATLERLPVYNGLGQQLPEDTIPLVEMTSGGLRAPCTSD